MRGGRVKPVPAPVGGWNASSSYDGMKPTDAITLDNWFPTTDSVVTRGGYTQHATSLSDDVETLIEFAPITGTNKLIAASGAVVYDATSASPSTLASSFTSAQWQSMQKNGLLIMVNGADAPQSYDGSTFTAATISGSGLTVTNLIDCCVFFNRGWYVEKDTLNAWYSAADAVAGALTKFPLANIVSAGGFLKSIYTWSRDDGDGADDLIVFLISTGETLVYQGDPGGTFAIVGRWFLPKPLSIRCGINYQSDLWLITEGGIVSLSDVVRFGTDKAVDKSINYKIKDAFRSVGKLYGARFGWEAVYYPAQEMVIFNVPSGTGYVQYVVNVITGAWCSFSGMSAFCWSVFNNDLYFGGSTIVYKADDGNDDDGSNIECNAIQAFVYLSQAQKTQVTMVQPSVKLNGLLNDNISVGSDFEVGAVPSSPIVTQTPSAAWGSPWGTAWSSEGAIEDRFVAVGNWGYNHSIRFLLSTDATQTRWYSTRWVFKSGGLV
jgi:hypothetical protein